MSREQYRRPPEQRIDAKEMERVQGPTAHLLVREQKIVKSCP